MAAFDDTKTSSDPPVTHVPFADYVIAVVSCTVDCILCSFEDTSPSVMWYEVVTLPCIFG